MGTNKYEAGAVAAAEWWTKNIGSNAKQISANEMQSLFLRMCSSSTRISDEQLKKFFKLLKKRVMKELETGRYVNLTVDNVPDEILAEVARECGISNRAFPCQTSMWIDSKQVVVSCGYGSEQQEIYNISNGSKIHVQEAPEPGSY